MLGAGQPTGGPGQDLPRARDRGTWITVGLLLAVTAAAWVGVVSSPMAGDGPMADDHMGASPLLVGGLAFVAAWGAMMTAMMLPSALPMITLYGAIQRRSSGSAQAGAPVALFAVVYLGLWTAVGVPVYVAGRVLGGLASAWLPYAIAVVLVAAGAYKLSPLKQVCLRACRSPFGFLVGHWRAGYVGSLSLGWAHAAYCLGCCWALMVVLVAAGAMSLPWVLLIAAVVATEKLLPGGELTARVAGAALVLLGLAVALQPDLAMVLRSSPAM